ncbi:hypothetical protein K402DRAFT_25457 [Aulographum hederae CBS 113979]|uniref:Uncharacterized protein n=1 Tax=Aulographum hederae CBS 113979 TaxID=1176131 RepID=A0A6G1H618_9PEZI|nr:hypothetical protein K402DRAFT_25457 [Aulographum hederae CBS 113979]
MGLPLKRITNAMADHDENTPKQHSEWRLYQANGRADTTYGRYFKKGSCNPGVSRKGVDKASVVSSLPFTYLYLPLDQRSYCTQQLCLVVLESIGTADISRTFASCSRVSASSDQSSVVFRHTETRVVEMKSANGHLKCVAPLSAFYREYGTCQVPLRVAVLREGSLDRVHSSRGAIRRLENWQTDFCETQGFKSMTNQIGNLLGHSAQPIQ